MNNRFQGKKYSTFCCKYDQQNYMLVYREAFDINGSNDIENILRWYDKMILSL